MSLGVTEACRAIGVKPIHSFAIEWDPVFAEVYRSNFKPKQQTVGDIVDVMPGRLGAPLTTEEKSLQTKVGSVDLLCGGPPCQGHSDLNNYTRRNDPRNSLYNRMARAADIFAPSTILIENVPGVQRDKTGVFSETVSFLENAGYNIKILTLNAADFGVPQSRKRTFVIASKLPKTLESLEATLGAIKLKKPRSVEWALTPVNAGNAEFYQASKLSKESSERVQWLFDNDQHELPDRLRPDCHKLKRHSYKSVYGRMFADKPAPTITTGCLVMGQGRFIHPHEPRTITPHEAARLQSFPDFFDFGVQNRTTYAKMIGNAVPPLLAYAVSLSILCQ